MKTVKYLIHCFISVLSQNCVFTREFVFGLVQLVLYFAVFFISNLFLSYYYDLFEIEMIFYSLLITIVFILILYICVVMVECFVRLLLKLKNNSKKF